MERSDLEVRQLLEEVKETLNDVRASQERIEGHLEALIAEGIDGIECPLTTF